MYVRRVGITDFRGISSLEWKLDRKQPAPGWHVIIGDNGSGKSTVLRAIALALVGPFDAPGLRQNWNDWIRFGRGSSLIKLQLECTSPFEAGKGKSATVGIAVRRHPVPHVQSKGTSAKAAWSATNGWFAASYGPFRRFSGGDREWDGLLQSNPRLARHLSIFSESVALTSGLSWLRDLKIASLTRRPRTGPSLDDVVRFVNQPGFLPHGMTLDEVTPDEVVFRDPAKARVWAENLSDGFRSVLSMTFELLRQLYLGFPKHNTRIFDKQRSKILMPGVVLIDEVDAHLHPTWQRAIGPWFCRHFPQVQFVVTTHSPLVCQASEHGTVFHLPTPGLGGQAAFITGTDRDRLVSGNVTEAYSTGAFGLRNTRSDAGQEKVRLLVELNTRALTQGLTRAQRVEQERLRAALPTAASDVSV